MEDAEGHREQIPLKRSANIYMCLSLEEEDSASSVTHKAFGISGPR